MTHVPHVWTIDEIQALPEFGGKSPAWFYGLVAGTVDDEECIALAEIIAGFGYSYVDPTELDADVWSMAVDDLSRPAPASWQAAWA